MRNPKTVSYTFNPTTRVLDFSGTQGFDVRNLAGVIHPSGALIYFPGKAGLGLDLLRSSGSVVALQYNTSNFGASDPLIVIYEDGTAALPANASTADRQDAAKVLLQQILAAVQNERAETIWTDDTGVRFIRVDKGGVISWTDLAGNASSAPGTGARPDNDSSTVVSHSTYRATSAGTGFAVNDILDHIVVTDGDAGDLVSNFWINVTSGAKISAPTNSTITPLAPLPDGAATSQAQATSQTTLSSILASLGAPSDTAAASDGANSGLIGLMRRALGYLGGLLSVFTPPIDASGALATTGDVVPVSAAGRNTVLVALATGSWTGSLVVEGSASGDFTDAVALSVLPYGGGPAVSALTAAGTYEATCTGLAAVRVRASGAITGGPVSAFIRTAIGNKSIRIGTPASSPLPVLSPAVTTSDSTATLTAALNAQLLAANSARQFLEVTNTGANPMTIRFGSAATATAGRSLAPGQTATYSGAVPAGSLQAFSAAGTTAFVTAG